MSRFKDEDAEFVKKHGKHLSVTATLTDEDVATLNAAAKIIREKMLPEIMKHAECGDDNGPCGLYEPELAAGLMQMDLRLRSITRAYAHQNEALERNDDDIPAFVKQIIEQVFGGDVRSGHADADDLFGGFTATKGRGKGTPDA